MIDDAEGLMFSLKGGEEGDAAAAIGAIGGSSLGITTGGIGATFGMGAHVRGTVAGLDSGVVAVAVAVVAVVVVLAEAVGVAFKAAAAAVAGRLLG